MVIAVSAVTNSTTAAVTTVMYSLKLSSSSAAVVQVEVAVGVVRRRPSRSASDVERTDFVLNGGTDVVVGRGSVFVLENGCSWSLLEKVCPRVEDASSVAALLEIEGLGVSEGVLEEDAAGGMICELVIVVKSAFLREKERERERGGREQ